MSLCMLCSPDYENKLIRLEARIKSLERENKVLLMKCNALDIERNRLLTLNALHKSVILRNLDDSFIFDDIPEIDDIPESGDI